MADLLTILLSQLNATENPELKGTGLSNEKAVLELLSSDKLALYIGAGLGAGIYPIWKEALNELAIRCAVKVPTEITDPTKIAEHIKNHGTDYKKKVYEIFKSRRIIQINIAHLWRLKSNMIVTTNYEHSIIKALEAHDSNIRAIAYPNLNIHNTRPGYCTVFHIHGYFTDNSIEHEEDIPPFVLSESEFNEAYNANNGSPTPLNNFLVNLFSNYDILFIGSGFGDINVLKILASVARDEQGNDFKKPKRIALMDVYEFDAHKAKRKGEKGKGYDFKALDLSYMRETLDKLKSYGVSVYWYNSKNSHSALEQLFTRWGNIINTSSGSDATKERTFRNE